MDGPCPQPQIHLDVEADDVTRAHTHLRGYETLIVCILKDPGESRSEMRARPGAWLRGGAEGGFLHVGQGLRWFDLPLAPEREHPGSLISLTLCGQEGRAQGWAEKLSGPQTSKNGARHFITIKKIIPAPEVSVLIAPEIW